MRHHHTLTSRAGCLILAVAAEGAVRLWADGPLPPRPDPGVLERIRGAVTDRPRKASLAGGAVVYRQRLRELLPGFKQPAAAEAEEAAQPRPVPEPQSPPANGGSLHPLRR